MMMEGAKGVQLKGLLVTQPVDDAVQEHITGPALTHCDSVKASGTHYNVLQNTPLKLSVQADVDFLHQTPIAVCSDDQNDGAFVVDMRPHHQLENIVTHVRESGLSEQDCNINVRGGFIPVIETDAIDLQVRHDEHGQLASFAAKQTSSVCLEEVDHLLSLPTAEKGIIFNEKVLACNSGVYVEGHQYETVPSTESKGAYGEAVMCRDLKSGKTFIRKKVKERLSKNEVMVPLKFKGNMGIPEVFGIIRNGQNTEIFQEFAGLSLKKLCEMEYIHKLRDPGMLMVLAFQAFATLDKLHNQGVTHQDIKPENVCIDTQGNTCRLKFIDFGSSQTSTDLVTEGLTNEYLSPESCNALLQVATQRLPREQGRLGPGTDVWAMALTFMYCLCGYHVMVYACTGNCVYQETTPEELQKRRILCLLKVAQMTDQFIEQRLFHREWPTEIRTLLLNTLRVNPNERWSAKEAALYILQCLKNKTAMEPKPSVPKVLSIRLSPQTQASTSQPQALIFQTQGQPCTPQPEGLVCHLTEMARPALAVQSTTDTAAGPSDQLPVFDALLPNDVCKMAPRAYKRKHGCEQSAQPTRIGHKVMKK